MVKDARAHVQKLESQDKRALRDGFGDAMMLLGEKEPRVVALCADLTESDRLVKFREKYPNRFVEIGVAEQNLAGVAAGMAHAGKIPFSASFAVFHPGRSWDQVRVSMCYSNANAKIYGGHAGLTVGEDGATHQALEDVAITRVLPRMTVIVPADAIEMRKATLAAAQHVGPVYLRGGREKQPQITTEQTPFAIGEANLLRDGKDVTIVACGIMVREAMLAAAQLGKEKISARVLGMHTIKPLDVDAIVHAAHDTGAIVTAEEHQIIGGLGGAVAEALGTHYPVPLERVGVNDTFGESGAADALLDKYGLRAADIARAAKRAIERKKRKGLPEIALHGPTIEKIHRASKKTSAKAASPAARKKESAKAKKKK
jgi:transketolase